MQTPETTVHIHTKRQISPEILQAAKTDPGVAHMIKHGMPLNRQTWIDLNWGSEVPKPWTAEDEMQVPVPFRRVL